MILVPTIPIRPCKPPSKPRLPRKLGLTLHSDTLRPFAKPTSGRIAVQVINHLDDEMVKMFRV